MRAAAIMRSRTLSRWTVLRDPEQLGAFGRGHPLAGRGEDVQTLIIGAFPDVNGARRHATGP